MKIGKHNKLQPTFFKNLSQDDDIHVGFVCVCAMLLCFILLRSEGGGGGVVYGTRTMGMQVKLTPCYLE